MSSASSPASGAEVPSTPQSVPDSQTSRKGARNQKACDACRARKVKCLSAPGTDSCRRCLASQLQCTQNRPRRKRGPPSRYELLQARESPRGLSWGPQSNSGDPITRLPASAPIETEERAFEELPNLQFSAPTTASWNTNGDLLHQLTSEDILQRVVADWFERIHPLAPVLHRSTFTKKLRAGLADTCRSFCGLVVSVCAATVATLPREAYGSISVTRCVDFIEAHQLLPCGILRPSYTVEWCISMYNIGVAIGAFSEVGVGDLRSYRCLSEAAAGVRYLVYYHMSELDTMDQQLLKRLFWLLFAAAQSADIFGRLPHALQSYNENLGHLRPTVLTDNQLQTSESSSDRGITWDGEGISYVPGLNSLSDLFLIWHEVQFAPKSDNLNNSLRRYLGRIQDVINALPPELRWRGGLSRPSTITQGHDAQIANIFITSLHLRSNILQKFGIDHENAVEHQRIVDDLLEILYHLPQAVFDANGSSLVPKIRDIGAAYLENVMIRQRNGGLRQADESAKVRLEHVLRKLEHLDQWPGLGLPDTTITNRVLSETFAERALG